MKRRLSSIDTVQSLHIRRSSAASSCSNLSSMTDRLSELEEQVEKLQKEKKQLQRETDDSLRERDEELQKLSIENAAVKAQNAAEKMAAVEQAEHEHNEDTSNLRRMSLRTKQDLKQANQALQKRKQHLSKYQHQVSRHLLHTNMIVLRRIRWKCLLSHAIYKKESRKPPPATLTPDTLLQKNANLNQLVDPVTSRPLPLTIAADGRTVIGDKDGKVLVAPDGKPVQFQDGGLITSRNEEVTLVSTTSGYVALTKRHDIDGKAVTLRDGRAVFDDAFSNIRVLDGRIIEVQPNAATKVPLTASDGRVVVRRAVDGRPELEDTLPVVLQSGRPFVWSNGNCCVAGSDGKTVLGNDGRVLLGRDNRPITLASDGRAVDSTGLTVDLAQHDTKIEDTAQPFGSDGKAVEGVTIAPDGRTILGPDGRVVMMKGNNPVELQHGRPVDSSGQPVRVIIYRGEGIALVPRLDGTTLKNGSQLYHDKDDKIRTEGGVFVYTRNNIPVRSKDGRVVLDTGSIFELEDGTPVVVNHEGTPFLWGNGDACIVGHDRRSVLGNDGRVIRGTDGRPIHVDSKGKACDAEGRPVALGSDGTIVGRLSECLVINVISSDNTPEGDLYVEVVVDDRRTRTFAFRGTSPPRWFELFRVHYSRHTDKTVQFVLYNDKLGPSHPVAEADILVTPRTLETLAHTLQWSNGCGQLHIELNTEGEDDSLYMMSQGIERAMSPMSPTPQAGVEQATSPFFDTPVQMESATSPMRLHPSTETAAPEEYLTQDQATSPPHAGTTDDLVSNLYKAMKGLGTDEEAIYNVLSEVAMPDVWRDVQEEFQLQYPTFHEGVLLAALKEELNEKELNNCKLILKKRGIILDTTPAPVTVVDLCQKLYGAMKGLGTDEKAIYESLSEVTSCDMWKEVQHQFGSIYPNFHKGVLLAALKDELNEAELSKCRVVLKKRGIDLEPAPSFETPEVIENLFKAMKGFGTDETAIYENLSKVTSQEMWGDVKQGFGAAHPTFYEGDLVAALKDELNESELSKCKVIMRKSKLELEEKGPLNAIGRLYEAMKGFGTDENAIYECFSMMRSQEEWEQVKGDFSAVHTSFHGGDVLQALKSELSDADLDKCRLILKRRGIVLELPTTLPTPATPMSAAIAHMTSVTPATVAIDPHPHSHPSIAFRIFANLKGDLTDFDSILHAIREVRSEAEWEKVKVDFKQQHAVVSRSDLPDMLKVHLDSGHYNQAVKYLRTVGVEVDGPYSGIRRCADGKTALLGGHALLGAGGKVIIFNDDNKLTTSDGDEVHMLGNVPLIKSTQEGLYLNPEAKLCNGKGDVVVLDPLTNFSTPLKASSKLVIRDVNSVCRTDDNRVVIMRDGKPLSWKSGTVMTTAPDGVTVLSEEGRVIQGIAGRLLTYEDGRILSGNTEVTLVESIEGIVVLTLDRPYPSNAKGEPCTTAGVAVAMTPEGNPYRSRDGRIAMLVTHDPPTYVLEDGVKVLSARGGGPLRYPDGAVVLPDNNTVLADPLTHLPVTAARERLHPVVTNNELLFLTQFSEDVFVSQEKKAYSKEGLLIEKDHRGEFYVGSDGLHVVKTREGGYLMTDGRPVVAENGKPFVWSTGKVCTTAVDKKTVLGPSGNVVPGPDGTPLQVTEGGRVSQGVSLSEVSLLQYSLEHVSSAGLLSGYELHNALSRMKGEQVDDMQEQQEQILELQKILSSEVGRLQTALKASQQELSMVVDDSARREATFKLLSAVEVHEATERLFITTSQVEAWGDMQSMAGSVRRVPFPASAFGSAKVELASPATPLGRRSSNHSNNMQRVKKHDVKQASLRVGESVELVNTSDTSGSLRGSDVGIVADIDVWCERPFYVRGPRGEHFWYRHTDVKPATRHTPLRPTPRPSYVPIPTHTPPKLLSESPTVQTYVSHDIKLAEFS